MSQQNSLGAISTCPNGDEKYTYFNLTPRPRKRGRYIQYEWRDPMTGKLFSTVAPTLEQCRAKRDKWLKNISCG
ncbi:MAG: DUF3873 family protein [Rikenellaceae bacterium]